MDPKHHTMEPHDGERFSFEKVVASTPPNADTSFRFQDTSSNTALLPIYARERIDQLPAQVLSLPVLSAPPTMYEPDISSMETPVLLQSLENSAIVRSHMISMSWPDWKQLSHFRNLPGESLLDKSANGQAALTAMKAARACERLLLDQTATVTTPSTGSNTPKKSDSTPIASADTIAATDMGVHMANPPSKDYKGAVVLGHKGDIVAALMFDKPLSYHASTIVTTRASTVNKLPWQKENMPQLIEEYTQYLAATTAMQTTSTPHKEPPRTFAHPMEMERRYTLSDPDTTCSDMTFLRKLRYCIVGPFTSYRVSAHGTNPANLTAWSTLGYVPVPSQAELQYAANWRSLTIASRTCPSSTPERNEGKGHLALVRTDTCSKTTNPPQWRRFATFKNVKYQFPKGGEKSTSMEFPKLGLDALAAFGDEDCLFVYSQNRLHMWSARRASGQHRDRTGLIVSEVGNLPACIDLAADAHRCALLTVDGVIMVFPWSHETDTALPPFYLHAEAAWAIHMDVATCITLDTTHLFVGTTMGAVHMFTLHEEQLDLPTQPLQWVGTYFAACCAPVYAITHRTGRVLCHQGEAGASLADGYYKSNNTVTPIEPDTFASAVFTTHTPQTKNLTKHPVIDCTFKGNVALVHRFDNVLDCINAETGEIGVSSALPAVQKECDDALFLVRHRSYPSLRFIHGAAYIQVIDPRGITIRSWYAATPVSTDSTTTGPIS